MPGRPLVGGPGPRSQWSAGGVSARPFTTHGNCCRRFPNKIVALQFEWQWQHPKSSRILRGRLDFNAHGRGWRSNLQVLAALLRAPLWEQLSLAVHLLSDDAMAFYRSLSPEGGCSGGAVRGSPLDFEGAAGETLPLDGAAASCGRCSAREGRAWRCPCSAVTHLVCSARLGKELLPSALHCDECGESTRFSDAVRLSFGLKAGRVSLEPAVDEDEGDSDDDCATDASDDTLPLSADM